MADKPPSRIEIDTLVHGFARVKQAADEALQYARLTLGDRHPLTREARRLAASATDVAALAIELRGKGQR